MVTSGLSRGSACAEIAYATDQHSDYIIITYVTQTGITVMYDPLMTALISSHLLRNNPLTFGLPLMSCYIK